MSTGVRLRALAAVIAGAVMVAGAGGCSSAVVLLPGAGLAGYWTESRLLAALPWLAFGYLPGR